jgi:hypothetical protein
MSTFNGTFYALTLNEGPPKQAVSGQKQTPALKEGAVVRAVTGERAIAKPG